MRIKYNMPWEINSAEFGYNKTKTGTMSYYKDDSNFLIVGPQQTLNGKRKTYRGNFYLNTGWQQLGRTSSDMEFYVESQI